MDFPNLNNWTSAFPFWLGGLLHFYSNFDRKANNADPDQTPRSAVSDLGLLCLPMSHKKDARLIHACVK